MSTSVLEGPFDWHFCSLQDSCGLCQEKKERGVSQPCQAYPGPPRSYAMAPFCSRWSPVVLQRLHAIMSFLHDVCTAGASFTPPCLTHTFSQPCPELYMSPRAAQQVLGRCKGMSSEVPGPGPC